MALMLCVFAKISPRKVAKVLEVFNFMLSNALGKIPEHTTIRTWIAKSGLDAMSNKAFNIEEAYALVVDGSISVGDQQMMLVLKVPADHNGKAALGHADAEVVGMQVEKNWKAEDVNGFMQDVIDEQLHSPEYCITDNGTNLKKAITDLGIPHHRDISHTFATFLKAVYNEDAEFRQFSESVGKTKHLALSDVAYLMPCKQRTIARFMNVYPTVNWASKVLDCAYRFTAKEKMHYSFVSRNASLVDELEEDITVFEEVMELCKNKGLSVENAAKCKATVKSTLSCGSARQRELMTLLISYLDKESQLLTEEHPIHYISSDIIESKFSLAKSVLSPCKTCGFTESVLMLPLTAKYATLESTRKVDIKSIMERTRMNDIAQWKRKHLRPNPLIKRREKLSA